MLKNKLFLHGLGSGIIAGAILLQLMTSVSQADSRLLPGAPEQLSASDEETIVQLAEEMGYQVFNKEDKLYTQQQVDELLKQAAEQPEAAQSTETQSEQEMSAQAEQETSEAEQSDPEAEKVDVPSGIIRFTIPSGANSTEVSIILAEMGLIDDKKTFEQTLIRKKLASRIKAGSYELDHLLETDQLIQLITR